MKQICVLAIILLMVSFFISSCEKKETYLNGFQTFINDVRRDGPNYTEEEWERAHSSHDKFVEILYKKYGKELTEEDRVQISKLKGTYAALKIKAQASKMNENLLEAALDDELTSQEQHWNLD